MRILITTITYLIFGLAQVTANDTFVLEWWNALSQDERIELQTDLVLTGHYDALVDAEIGPATIAALRAFQSENGGTGSGVLTANQRDRLSAEASAVFSRLGMKLVEDLETGLSTFVPLGLMQKVDSSEGATTYRSEDEELAFLLLGGPSEGATIEGVREFLVEPKNGRTIAYTSMQPNRVIVSGKENEVRFYTLLALEGPRLLGYSVTWTATYDHVGQMLAVLAASYTFPFDTSTEVAPPPQPTTSSSTFNDYDREGERVGAFLLPTDEYEVVVLDGTINENAALDFLRALRKRPSATTLSLNSPGGLVGNALLIAHEARERGLRTIVPEGYGCYSACAYIFFSGKERRASGELGVHQVYGDSATVATAQSTLSDVLDALAEFGVEQEVISVMLRTPPEQMYVFSEDELLRLRIDSSSTWETSERSTGAERGAANGQGDANAKAAGDLVALIKACMTVPAGALDAGATTRLQVEIERGRIVSGPRALVAPTTDLETQMMIAGMRAIDECAPYPSTFSGVVNVTFDPSEG